MNPLPPSSPSPPPATKPPPTPRHAAIVGVIGLVAVAVLLIASIAVNRAKGPAPSLAEEINRRLEQTDQLAEKTDRMLLARHVLEQMENEPVDSNNWTPSPSHSARFKALVTEIRTALAASRDTRRHAKSLLSKLAGHYVAILAAQSRKNTPESRAVIRYALGNLLKIETLRDPNFILPPDVTTANWNTVNLIPVPASQRTHTGTDDTKRHDGGGSGSAAIVIRLTDAETPSGRLDITISRKAADAAHIQSIQYYPETGVHPGNVSRLQHTGP